MARAALHAYEQTLHAYQQSEDTAVVSVPLPRPSGGPPPPLDRGGRTRSAILQYVPRP